MTCIMKKVIVGTLLVIALIFAMTPTTVAAENDSSANITINIQAMNNITNTTNTISIAGSSLYSSSSIRSNSSVDTLGLRIYLQRKQTKWGNTGQSREYLGSNTTSLSKTTQFSLQSGYQYRVKVVHFIKNNGSYESEITYSNIYNFN